MAKNKHGGGAKTNENGLKFEQETSLKEALIKNGFKVSKGDVYLGKKHVAVIGDKKKFQKRILEPLEIDMKKILSSELLPDEALLNLKNNTIYIIEKKFQNGSGSVDEKLQTCDFKRKQYKKLFKNVGIKVEYGYVCNYWFKKDKYKDVIDYIKAVKCNIFFDEIPIDFLGLK